MTTTSQRSERHGSGSGAPTAKGPAARADPLHRARARAAAPTPFRASPPCAPPSRTPVAPHPRSYSLAPLIDDCKLLGILLDDCLKADVGTELFNKVRGGGGAGRGVSGGARGGAWGRGQEGPRFLSWGLCLYACMGHAGGCSVPFQAPCRV